MPTTKILLANQFEFHDGGDKDDDGDNDDDGDDDDDDGVGDDN